MTEFWIQALSQTFSGLENPPSSEDGLTLHTAGRDFSLAGEAGGSATVHGDEGFAVFADLDGDGVVDQVAEVRHDGSYKIFRPRSFADAEEYWGLEQQEVQESSCLLSEPATESFGDIVDDPVWGVENSFTPVKGKGILGEFHKDPEWTCMEWG